MSQLLVACRRWLRGVLAGKKLERALERNQHAARELDKAVREVFER